MKNLQARLHSIQWLASGIQAFELKPVNEDQWPVATAGSHVDLQLPNGQTRSYSLVNTPSERNRYVVAVSRDALSRGGSRYMHDQLRVGQVLSISEPRNTFSLVEAGSESVLIAGGIGVTPLWSMAQRLSQIGAPWTLHYSARTRDAAAFVDDFEALALKSGGRVHLNFDEGMSDRRMDLQSIVDALAPDAHVYCCGPAPMISAFERACAQRDPALVHREFFAPPTPAVPTAATSEKTIMVTLAKSGKTISVDADVSVLDAVLKAGVDAPYSCMSGICGACATTVLCGVPDHRDFVLSEQERQSGDVMLICCSRASSSELTLDL